MRAGRPRRRDDDGQVLLLILLYCLIVLLLVTVLASATAVHLERNRLIALADAAALDAADSLDEATFFDPEAGGVPEAPDGGAVPLSDDSVRDAVTAYLEGAPAAARFDALTVGDLTGAPDDRTAQVSLSCRARLPLLTFVLSTWADGVPLTVTSRARTRLVP